MIGVLVSIIIWLIFGLLVLEEGYIEFGFDF